jgi:hypothetical protein
MRNRIERQPAVAPRRAIAEPIGCVGVEELVDREGDQQEETDEQDRRDGLVGDEWSAEHRSGSKHAGRHQMRPSRSAFFCS